MMAQQYQDSDSEEEKPKKKLRFKEESKELNSIEEGVDYDSDEDRNDLLEKECELTGEQLNNLTLIGKLGKF